MSRAVAAIGVDSVALVPLCAARAALGLALAIAFAVLLPAGSAAQTGVPLLGSYCGDYRWEASPVVSAVRIHFQHHALRTDSKIDVEGVGWSTNPHDGVRTRFLVRAVLDPATGRLSMTESVGSDVADWVTDGTYEGQVQPDGGGIVANWTSRQPPHSRGVLRLRRCGSSDPAV